MSAPTKKKFALISYHLPPTKTPHGAIIRRLLRDLPADSYCLLSSSDDDFGTPGSDSDRLPGNYHRLGPPFQFSRGYRFGLQSDRVKTLVAVVSHTWAIAKILRRERCDAVIVCTGGFGLLDFPAAYFASRLVGAKFYAYLLDQYLNMIHIMLGKSVLENLERVVIKGATAVIAPNEFLRDEMRRLYGVDATIVHHPCEVDASPQQTIGAPTSKADEIRIVYTGSVGDLYAEALRNLVAALDLIGRDNLRLHLYCRQSQAECEQAGVKGRVTYHGSRSMSEIPSIQRDADILFLPLAFNSPYAEHLRTSTPGKMGEFLAAGRPILVNTPPDCFTSWYFRRHECGLLVDQNDPAILARALESLVHDSNLQQVLSERARKRAQIDFAVSSVRAQFFNAIRRPMLSNGTQPATRPGSAAGAS
jgi:glycosyltransferase involved in cell wall biosynthesis